MTDKEIVYLGIEIKKMCKAGQLNEAYNLYKDLNHPEIFYNLGIQAFNLDDIRMAKICFIKGAELGTGAKHPYYDTFFANSVGQCIMLLHTQNLLTTQNQEVLRKLFAYGYIYLSSAIRKYGNRAYESHEARFKIIMESNFKEMILNLLVHQGVLAQAIPMMNAFDLQQSGTGFLTYSNNIQYADSLSHKAYDILDYLLKTSNFKNPSYESFFEIGKTVHELLYKNLENIFLKEGSMIKDEIV
jgi:hypothetical protein